ncbi:hypothetical protein PVK06_048718 [Gossypium arboreum]|uniref:C2 domain-containing protein n=1 Tax=Gossypium arboreum TaxID=29729 RepID=A0ABR0MJD0_GOSAR|nr:hypothetical protein PVK06_048718 [Gossypium arboreum]
MDSPQSVVSPFKSYVVAESEQQQKSELFTRNSGGLSDGSEVNTKEAVVVEEDVYAKLCLISDPESTVSTKIINGGERDPMFNENLRLKVRTIDSSLKFEIFMMSRVRNYLEDQLLGRWCHCLK